MRPCLLKLGLPGVLVVLVTALGTLAYGQGTAVTGSLFRIVADPSGAILPGVDVRLKNNSTVTAGYRDPTYSQDPGGRVLQVSWRVSF